MPTYIRPKRVDITEGGGWIVPLVMTVLAAVAVVAVVSFILAHLVLLAVMAAVLVAGTLGTVMFLKRFTVVTHSIPAPRHPIALAATPQRALPAPPLAIAPAQHLHVHLHGVDAAEAAAILARREIQP